MTDEAESPRPRPSTAREERAERLAAQLRANLRRRKEQVRGRDLGEARADNGKPDAED